MESLNVENLMKTDNPILHRILQHLDFYSLEKFSLAIADTYLWNSLNISFDLERKLKPWIHDRRQQPLKLYWRYQSYDINYANSYSNERRCTCVYCEDLICCFFHWYEDWNYCYFCNYNSVCPFCYQSRKDNKQFKTKRLSSYTRKLITDRLKYRSLYKRPYTRSWNSKKQMNN